MIAGKPDVFRSSGIRQFLITTGNRQLAKPLEAFQLEYLKALGVTSKDKRMLDY